MGDFLIWPFFERLLVWQALIALDLSQSPAEWSACSKGIECTYPAEMYLKYYEGI